MKKGISLLVLLIAVCICTGCIGAYSYFTKTFQNQSYYRISSRWYRPVGSTDQPGTIEVINELKPSAVEWTYCEDPEVLAKYKELGVPYSLAMNPQLVDSAGYTTPKMRIKDFEGKPYVAPWMKSWDIKNPYWGCVNNPEFYQLFLKQGLKLANLGAYSIMVDDAYFNVRLGKEKLVGCFCSHCLKKFNDYRANSNAATEVKILLSNSKRAKRALNGAQNKLAQEYTDFQEKCVVEFLEKWTTEVRKQYPNILFYTNNYGGEWNDIYKVFDGGIAEVNGNMVTDAKLDSLYAVASRYNKQQIFTLFSDNEDLHYKLMDYNAKHKKITLLPWDVYIPNKPRYFMKIETMKAMMAKLKEQYNYE